MIARLWRGTARADAAEAYLRHLEEDTFLQLRQPAPAGGLGRYHIGHGGKAGASRWGRRWFFISMVFARKHPDVIGVCISCADRGYCICTEDFEFETEKVEEVNTWLLNGAVAGGQAKVVSQVKRLSDQIRWAGYKTRFEIYDEDFNCIAEYPAHEEAV